MDDMQKQQGISDSRDAHKEMIDKMIERRKDVRKSLKINRIFLAQVGDDEEDVHLPMYFYIVDISLGGLKITSDVDLPVERAFNMYLTLEEKTVFKSRFKVAWKKAMFGGTQMMGIQFMDVDDINREILGNFIEHNSPENKRRAYRLNKNIPLDISIEGEEEEKLSTYTLDISYYGMKTTVPFQLPQNINLLLLLKIETQQEPLMMKARIAWQNQTSYDRNLIGCEFTEIEPDTAARLAKYIDAEIKGDVKPKIYKELPADLFDFPQRKDRKGK